MYRGLLIVIFLSLAGCLNAVITGVQLALDRHEISEKVSNHHIKMQANQRLYAKTHQFDQARISVASFEGDLLLVGQVPTKALKATAAAQVNAIKGVSRLYNEIEVKKNLSFFQQSQDAWLTLKVRAAIFSLKHIDPKSVKVVTENKTVYLMGHIKQSEAKKIVAKVRRLRGVKRVVRLFRELTYIHSA